MSREWQGRVFDLEDLRIFLEISEAGGISPAAARLGVSKSVVSRKLSKLEREIGAQLLTRNTRGSNLTAAGETFRAHAARAYAELIEAQEAIKPGGLIRGRLRLAAPVTFGSTHIAPVLAELALRNPQLAVHTTYSDRYVDLIAEGFDAGIRIGFLKDSALIVRQITPFYGKIVASPDYIARRGHPTSIEDLTSHDAITQGIDTWRLLDGEKTVLARPRGRFRADSADAIAAAAVAGLGLANLPDFLTERHLAAGTLVPVLVDHPIPAAGIYIVWPPSAQPSRAVQALTDLMLAAFGKGRWSRRD